SYAKRLVNADRAALFLVDRLTHQLYSSIFDNGGATSAGAESTPQIRYLFDALYDKIRRSEQKYKVALEVLTYHNQCTEAEFEDLKEEPIPDMIESIPRFEFTDYLENDNDKKPMMSLYMFKDLFGLSR
ncbi:PREDICTED: probable 3',5'-cyclic phosphodiesterase pde-5, partial [Priapulus caudatus]|uniref:Probable 3',5'-cyclic phosphodiesterase pde-5 n=1 Tax=Priapulus caudatus TaxID=37621 RepID=A0ABM1F725_PRICU